MPKHPEHVYPKWADPKPTVIEVSKQSAIIYSQEVRGTGLRVETLGGAGDRYTNPYTGQRREVALGNELISISAQGPGLERPRIERGVHERVESRNLHRR